MAAIDTFTKHKDKSAQFLADAILAHNPATKRYKSISGIYSYNGGESSVLNKGDKVRAYLLTRDDAGNETLWFHPLKAGSDAKDLLKYKGLFHEFGFERMSNATGSMSPVDLSNVWDWIFPPVSQSQSGSGDGSGGGAGGGGSAPSTPTPLSPTPLMGTPPIVIIPNTPPPSTGDTPHPNLQTGGGNMGGGTLVGTLNTSPTGGGTVSNAGNKATNGGLTTPPPSTTKSTTGTITGGSGKVTKNTSAGGGMASGIDASLIFSSAIGDGTCSDPQDPCNPEYQANLDAINNLDASAGGVGGGEGANAVNPPAPTFWQNLGDSLSNNAPQILTSALGAVTGNKTTTTKITPKSTTKSKAGVAVVIILVVAGISFGVYEILKSKKVAA